MTRSPSATRLRRLVVNPIACEGVGLCAHLAPRLVTLDRWGFPVTPDEPVTAREEATALRAARGCPRQALLLLAQDEAR